MTLGREQAEHINIVNWFNYQFPELADDLHHFANERACSIQQGKILKRMGVKRGVADFFLAIPIKRKDGTMTAGFWIELKVGKGTPSKEQIEFLDRKSHRGYETACVWGFDAACEMIKTYLKDFNSNSN